MVMKFHILLVHYLSFVTCDFTLNILHLNDLHARFEETNILSGRCTDTDKNNNNCFGGLGRIHSKVTELRNSLDNTIFLGGGDYYQGTVWYTIHKWKAIAYFLNIINHDAFAFGNHEFDDGIEGILPFLNNVTFPVIAANIDDSREPNFQNKYTSSVIKSFGETKVGIIGYLTTETEFIANPGRLKILNEVDSVRKEAQRLKVEGVDIIIALGHAGYTTDQDIAKNVEEIDIVVGGHTNTFLYTGEAPSTEPIVGPYPTIVKQASGREVLVVQAYAFGKYLGYLETTFNDEGEVISYKGNPILLDNSVPQDDTILKELVPWRAEINEVVKETIGRTFVFLDGDRLSCRMKECNLGNLITDAMVHQNAKYPDDMEWAKTGLAVTNGGSIRSSLNEKSSNGSISMEDIMVVAPFQNTIDIVELEGKYVKEMFEVSVSNYDGTAVNPPGGFLQVSGFLVVYDLENDIGHRVVKLEARCNACRIPIFIPVKDNEIYQIIMPSFLANGGDHYTVVQEKKMNHHLTGLLDTDVYSQYIKLYSPIYIGLENRIFFRREPSSCSSLNCYATSTGPSNDCQHVEIVPQAEHNNKAQTRKLCPLMSIVLFMFVVFIFK